MLEVEGFQIVGQEGEGLRILVCHKQSQPTQIVGPNGLGQFF